MCWGCKNGVPPLRIGSRDVTLEKWESPKMFPFKSMCGLSRNNTMIASSGFPYAWGYTYNGPYGAYSTKTKALFDTHKMSFDYEASKAKRKISQVKYEVEMLNFMKPDCTWRTWGRFLHVMSCHVMSCHVMSCHVMSCHVMSCHVHGHGHDHGHVMIMSCYLVICHDHVFIMSWSCHVMLWYIMACHVMACHFM